jgi:1-acyl-sn-glycerol-3-phosphate acyltransferase
LLFLVAPHTSNWDFIAGILTLFSLRIEIHRMGKHTMFKKPMAGLLKKVGGIPINCGSASVVVNETVLAFKNRKNLILAIAPEGTRKKVSKWKMGFYLIAQRASVPVVITTMDFKEKVVHFGPPIHLSEEKKRIFN